MKKLAIATELVEVGDGWGIRLTWCLPDDLRTEWTWERRLWDSKPPEGDYIAAASFAADACGEQQEIQGVLEVEDAQEQERLRPDPIIHAPGATLDIDALTGEGRY